MRLVILARSPELTYGLPPRVNLLPPAERQRRELGALARRWALIAGLVVAVVALLSLGVYVVERNDHDGLAKEEARTTELATRLSGFRDVSAAVRDLGSYQSYRSQAMATDLSWSSLLGTLQSSVPRGAAIVGFDARVGTPDASAGAAPAGGDPTAMIAASAPAGTAATVVLTVSSKQALDQRALVSALQGVPGVLAAELTQLSSDGYPTYSATTVVYLDDSVFSGRYVARAR